MKNIFRLLSYRNLALKIILLQIIAISVNSCKNKEQRIIIRNYTGSYEVLHTKVRCCNPQTNLLIEETRKINLEVKKSLKGIKINGIEGISDFKINSIDSTIYEKTKDGSIWANGKIHNNDSILITVHFYAKAPNYSIYSMKKR